MATLFFECGSFFRKMPGFVSGNFLRGFSKKICAGWQAHEDSRVEWTAFAPHVLCGLLSLRMLFAETAATHSTGFSPSLLGKGPGVRSKLATLRCNNNRPLAKVIL